jgi:uncharacterized protein (TIGR02722 family)
MKKILIIAAAAGFFFACGGTQYKDPSKAEGSAQWGPKEIKITSDKMVTSLYKFLKTEWKQPAFIQVKQFRNKTSEHIDTKMISNNITTELIKKRIKFIDDSLTADMIKEVEKSQTGMYDPDTAIPAGGLLQPNFFLAGEVRDNVRTVGSRTEQYLVVTITLHNVKTGLVEWQEEQEFLKSSSKTKVSF